MPRTIYIRTPYTSLIQKCIYVKKITDSLICVKDENERYEILETEYIVPKSEAIKEYKERVQKEAIATIEKVQSRSIDICDLIKELKCMKYQKMK